MAEKSCSVAGCQRPSYARGLCNAHYHRLVTHGEVMADRPIMGRGRRYWKKPEGTRCRSSVCDRPVHARGLCMAHWKRVMRSGRPNLGVEIRKYGKKKGDEE